MIICIFNCLSLHGNICQVGQKVHSVKHYRKTQINFLANPIEVILNSSYPKLNPWIAFLTWLWQPAPAQLLTTKGFILFSSVQFSRSVMSDSAIPWIAAKLGIILDSSFSGVLYIEYSGKSHWLHLQDLSRFTQFLSPLLNITLVQACFIPETYYYKSNLLLPFVWIFVKIMTGFMKNTLSNF